jgi:hypothetical protein
VPKGNSLKFKTLKDRLSLYTAENNVRLKVVEI